MTETPKEDKPDESSKLWNPLTEQRDWAAAATEANCYKIAKRKGKRVVEIINTKRGILPIICIFEDYPDD
ncbi:hypothetical protein H6F74_24880 [Trichocoleus sp. FACHB-90]|uniref:hypothetical protein n=1 Tax=Cyanophyceae TaxID=3028117 RepID=UPI0016870D04|nr:MULTISPECIES: hypothetical protein [unclassified Trichocoleus]MBD1929452.1 hypothetical protein [Trichocoleus sp. FACHB-90]MBD1935610.1 hypothetical protein [Trichocoleus sp. FACHB-69]